MIRIPSLLNEQNLNAKMLLTVHDELLFEVPTAQLDRTSQIISSAMEGAAAPAVEMSVPLVAEVGIGSNWAEAH
jgi:DNA polymerase-1